MQVLNFLNVELEKTLKNLLLIDFLVSVVTINQTNLTYASQYALRL